MNIKTIAEGFFDMEKDLGLFQKKIGDVHFWELVRFHVFSQITKDSGLHGQAHTLKETNLKNIYNYITRAVKNLFLKNPFLAPRCDILFFGHSRRRLMADGLWWDIYCDPVIEHLKDVYDCLLLENRHENTHFSPAKTAYIRYLDIAHVLGPFFRRTNLIGLSLTKNEEKLLDEIERQIHERFNVSITLRKIVSSELLMRKTTLPVDTYLIKKISPKAVVVVVSYGKESIIEACKKLSIPVVELQHGNISRYHMGYSFPGSSAVKQIFPDYFFTFGDYWKQLVDFPIPKEKLFSVGYPFFEMETAKYAHVNKKDQIVFISQGTIGGKMSKFAVELKAREDFSMDIIYKLHPGEYARWRKEYPWLIDSGVTVLDNDSMPLYKLFAQSRALVGVYSTAIYEGIGFGLRSFLLDLPGIEYMNELIESQAVSVISTVNELVDKMRRPSQQHIKADYFFKTNALDNICNTLDNIICREFRSNLSKLDSDVSGNRQLE